MSRLSLFNSPFWLTHPFGSDPERDSESAAGIYAVRVRRSVAVAVTAWRLSAPKTVLRATRRETVGL